MKCGHCGAGLVKAQDSGSVLLRNHGLVLKGGNLVFVCPKCKRDVTPTQDVRKQLILFLQRPPS